MNRECRFTKWPILLQSYFLVRYSSVRFQLANSLDNHPSVDKTHRLGISGWVRHLYPGLKPGATKQVAPPVLAYVGNKIE